MTYVVFGMSIVSVTNSDSARLVATDSAWRQFSNRTVEPTAIAVDAAIVTMASVVWGAFFGGIGGPSGPLTLLAISPIVCVLFIPAAKLAKLYLPSALVSAYPHVWKVATLWLVVVSLLGLAAFALELKITPQAGAAFTLLGLLGLLGHRIVWRLLARKAVAEGRLRRRRIVLISEAGTSSYSGRIPELDSYGYEIEHSLHVASFDDDAASVRAQIEQAIELSVPSNIDEVVIAADARCWPQLKVQLERLRQLPLPVSLMITGALAELVRAPFRPLDSSTLFEVQSPPLSAGERFAKRAIDLACAALGLLLLSPLLALVALLIKFDSPGQVLFRQTRLGFNGRPFKIFKFRTMNVLEDGAGLRQATPDDERTTSFGRWLRRMSIDELPQLFNVLKGDMSIVGPRPHAVAHDEQFERLISHYAYRRRMKPGITGFAQVNGYRGGTPKPNLMESRVKLDILYIENWSIWLDINIVARTLVEVVRGNNAY